MIMLRVLREPKTGVWARGSQGQVSSLLPQRFKELKLTCKSAGEAALLLLFLVKAGVLLKLKYNYSSAAMREGHGLGKKPP